MKRISCNSSAIKATLALALLVLLSAGAAEPAASDSNALPPQGQAGEPQSLSTLPSYVDAPAGKLSLYADFDHPIEKGIVLYLINRTERAYGFESQDDDIYIKLETKADDGRFVRAQTHRYSTCGNSYLNGPLLHPNRYCRLLGYQPRNGKKATIRFRMYHDFVNRRDTSENGTHTTTFGRGRGKEPITLISNEGVGLAWEEDIASARFDAMAIPYGDFETMLAMAMGRAKPADRYQRWSRNDAVLALGRFSSDEACEALAKLIHDKDVMECAVQALAKMSVESPSAETLYLNILNHEVDAMRAVAIAALTSRHVDETTVQFGKQRLKEKNATIRLAAVSLLAQLADRFPEAKRAVIEHTNDPDSDVRLLVEGLRESWSRVKK